MQLSTNQPLEFSQIALAQWDCFCHYVLKKKILKLHKWKRGLVSLSLLNTKAITTQATERQTGKVQARRPQFLCLFKLSAYPKKALLFLISVSLQLSAILTLGKSWCASAGAGKAIGRAG